MILIIIHVKVWVKAKAYINQQVEGETGEVANSHQKFPPLIILNQHPYET